MGTVMRRPLVYLADRLKPGDRTYTYCYERDDLYD